MARARTLRTPSRKRSSKALAGTPASRASDAVLSLSFDDFQAVAARWFLEQQLRAAGGRVAKLARAIRRNRTSTYHLLTKHGVDVPAVQAEFGLKPYAQKAMIASEATRMLQRWLLTSATARRSASAIIAGNGR
jgi:hypothetical protein